MSSIQFSLGHMDAAAHILFQALDKSERMEETSPCLMKESANYFSTSSNSSFTTSTSDVAASLSPTEMLKRGRFTEGNKRGDEVDKESDGTDNQIDSQQLNNQQGLPHGQSSTMPSHTSVNKQSEALSMSKSESEYGGLELQQLMCAALVRYIRTKIFNKTIKPSRL